MAIELTNVVPKHERRLRLVFTSPLAGGAFGSPAPAAYVLTRLDGSPNPTISASIVVAGSASNAELALGLDLVEGALYELTAIGIPALDSSTTTSASDVTFRFQTATKVYAVEPKTSNQELLLYGRDLVFDGVDFVETQEGDLLTIEGLRNVQGAFSRRMIGGPLAWAPQYSPRARQYVDSPAQSVANLRGSVESNALRDDRIRSVTAEFIFDSDDPTQSYIVATPVFTGGDTSQSVDVSVNLPSST